MKSSQISLLLVVALVHTSSFFGEYVFDDKTVVWNESFHNFWSFEWIDSRTMKRPVGRTLFAVQFEFLGSSPIVSHCVNIAIHVIAVLGMFRLLDLILRHHFREWDSSRRTLIVTSAALLWGVHPITTSTVTYSIQRYESLAAMGMLWSVFFGSDPLLTSIRIRNLFLCGSRRIDSAGC